MNLTSRALWICAFIAVVGIVGQWGVDGLFASLWRYPTAALLAALLYEGVVARQHPLDVRWMSGRKTRCAANSTAASRWFFPMADMGRPRVKSSPRMESMKAGGESLR